MYCIVVKQNTTNVRILVVYIYKKKNFEWTSYGKHFEPPYVCTTLLDNIKGVAIFITRSTVDHWKRYFSIMRHAVHVRSNYNVHCFTLFRTNKIQSKRLVLSKLIRLNVWNKSIKIVRLVCQVDVCLLSLDEKANVLLTAYPSGFFQFFIFTLLLNNVKNIHCTYERKCIDHININMKSKIIFLFIIFQYIQSTRSIARNDLTFSFI